MAEGQDANTASEPSMEEILASIRKIIADEEPAAPAPAPEPVAEDAKGEDVLELTQLVEEDGSVTDLKPQEEAAPEPVVAPPEPEPVPVPTPAPQPSVAPPVVEPNIVSERAATAAHSSLAALANMVQMERMAASLPPNGTPIGNGARTLEDMVRDLMKPMLKDWLDANLPAIVERLVQKEIERITRPNDN
jgi:cell pole-organizing protein PopZ